MYLNQNISTATQNIKVNVECPYSSANLALSSQHRPMSLLRSKFCVSSIMCIRMVLLRLRIGSRVLYDTCKQKHVGADENRQ